MNARNLYIFGTAWSSAWCGINIYEGKAFWAVYQALFAAYFVWRLHAIEEKKDE